MLLVILTLLVASAVYFVVQFIRYIALRRRKEEVRSASLVHRSQTDDFQGTPDVRQDADDGLEILIDPETPVIEYVPDLIF